MMRSKQRHNKLHKD